MLSTEKGELEGPYSNVCQRIGGPSHRYGQQACKCAKAEPAAISNEMRMAHADGTYIHTCKKGAYANV